MRIKISALRLTVIYRSLFKKYENEKNKQTKAKTNAINTMFIGTATVLAPYYRSKGLPAEMDEVLRKHGNLVAWQ